MRNILKDTDTKDVPHDRDDNTMTKVKWSTETNDIDNRFLREYDDMHKLMEDRQITDYYQAQRHIQSTMMGDTLVNQCKIDSILITCPIMIVSSIEFQSQCTTS